jgi:hypothetical protein
MGACAGWESSHTADGGHKDCYILPPLLYKVAPVLLARSQVSTFTKVPCVVTGAFLLQRVLFSQESQEDLFDRALL